MTSGRAETSATVARMTAAALTAAALTTVLTAVTAAALASAVVALSAGTGVAQPRGGGPSHVTAVSRYGNGTLTAAVRPTRLGPQVQLPGGVWIYCAADCAETLRREKLDFWETRQEEFGGRNWNR